MLCNTCGQTNLPVAAKFCPSCGARVAEEVPAGHLPVSVARAGSGAAGSLDVATLPPPVTAAGNGGVSGPRTQVETRFIPPPYQAAVAAGPVPEPAGFWRRAGARLMDGVIVFLLGILPAIAIYLIVYQAALPDGVATEDDKLLADGAGTWAAIGFYVLLGGIYAVIGWASGGTLGMRAVGLRLRTVDGHEAPGVGRALARWLVSIASFFVLGLGFFAVLWDKRRQTWHDAAAGTFVVESR
jgi:uncharacterized RDD family membrane protein YckC